MTLFADLTKRQLALVVLKIGDDAGRFRQIDTEVLSKCERYMLAESYRCTK